MTLRAIHALVTRRYKRWRNSRAGVAPCFGGPLDGIMCPTAYSRFYVYERGGQHLSALLYDPRTTIEDYKLTQRQRFEWRPWMPPIADDLPRIPYSAFTDPRDR